MNMKQRCAWASHASSLIQEYHDHVWGNPVLDDILCFKYLVMESAHAGLSWEMILKRESAYDLAYEGFNPMHVATFNEDKIEAMMHSGIVKHRGKIEASIKAAKIVNDITLEYGSFSHYLWAFVNHTPLITYRSPEVWNATSPLSDCISQDLKRRGMNFVGSKIIQAYIQGIGLLNDHDTACELCVRRSL
jgi:DNA-3-methyladenine glycosylase I